jgi:hypothetical protein
MWLFMPMFSSKIKIEIDINKRGVGGDCAHFRTLLKDYTHDHEIKIQRLI